ncbi:MAG: glycosyltransferase family 2 protein [Tannerella sp.]|jgi:glycosyltransferase involved in cell wall biosynthesis|nr:glycosyltransferase family 2 protein [Tannerella sp.]
MSVEIHSDPLISVIIPAYNNSDILETTLNSVINQTYSNLEILVVDDGSETDLYPMIKKLKDLRISYHKLTHTNANVARNYGINNSNGGFVAMLDSDDIWMNNHLESCLNLLLKEQADGLYGSLILRNKASEHENYIIVRLLYDNETMIDYLLSTGYGAQTSTLFMTQESARSILWDIKLNRHQDYDFVVRYNKQFKLIAKTEPTVIYTMRENKQQNIDFASCIKVIKDNKENISPDIYYNYNLNMLNLALSLNASNNIIQHYKKETTFYKEFMSYFQFMNIKCPRNHYEKAKYKLEYLWYILKVKIE